ASPISTTTASGLPSPNTRLVADFASAGQTLSATIFALISSSCCCFVGAIGFYIYPLLLGGIDHKLFAVVCAVLPSRLSPNTRHTNVRPYCCKLPVFSALVASRYAARRSTTASSSDQ